MKRVAWVMVNHNGGEETSASVRTLLDDMDGDDLIVLVDNGTHDGSGEEAAMLSARVRRLVNEENRPFAAATNRGLEYALKEGYGTVGLINPDVRVRPGMTEALVRSLGVRGEMKVAAASPVIFYDSPSGRIWFAGGRIVWPLRWTLHRGNGRSRDRAYRYAGTSSYLTGCCFVARAGVWRDVGLLDESYGMYAEDADWSVRARRRGHKLVVEPAAQLVHRVSLSSGGGRTPLKMTYRTVANRLFFRRHTPAWLKPVQAVLGEVVDTFYEVFLALTGQHEARRAFHRARTLKVGERIPWPPSRLMTKN